MGEPWIAASMWDVRAWVAADYYGSDREIFGYLHGPSGGSLQTVGAAENVKDVWQGFVPIVQAVPQPNSYSSNGRSAAELILSDKAKDIQDAVLPGGSGDPFATLDEAERSMLTELHRLGISSWAAATTKINSASYLQSEWEGGFLRNAQHCR